MFALRRAVSIACCLPALLLPGCGWGSSDKPQLIVYASLDREFSAPILKAYGERKGIEVLGKYDVESTKTVGLTEAIIREAPYGRCDLFWNNEILNTLRLKNMGLLIPFQPKNGADYPAQFRAKDGTWYGFAARARILLVNTKLVAEAERPTSLQDLINPRWKGKIGIAKPLAGTTATHAACLYVAWGETKAKEFFKALRANGVQVLSGNKQVATAVSNGEIAFGLTDTDDAVGELGAGATVTIVYPDREPGQLGTLFIPNTLAVIKGSRHQAQAEALANYLLSADIETGLANGPSAQIPLNTKVMVTPQVETPKTVHPMEIDFEAAARAWKAVTAYLESEFAG